MKKTICLISCLLLLPIIVPAQKIEKDDVVVLPKMNILYRGIPNAIEIAIPGVTSDKVTVTISNGTIKRVPKGWEVLPGEKPEAMMTVSVNNKKISEKYFRVKNIPAPVAVIAGKTDGTISKDILLKTDMIKVKLIDLEWDPKFTISSFSLATLINGFFTTKFSDSNRLTDEMKSIISKCVKEQKIIFEDIKALTPDGRIVELSPIVLKIE